MPRYLPLSGVPIDYPEPEPRLARLLERLARMERDPAVPEEAMRAVAFSGDNPLLVPDLLPGRWMVTKATLDEPAYHVVTDLLQRKTVEENRINPASMAAPFTVTVADAAEQIGISHQALRKAIEGRRIAAWVRDEQLYLSPAGIAAFEVGKRGPAPKKRIRPQELLVRIGNTHGQSFRMHCVPPMEGLKRVAPNVLEGSIPKWSRAGFIYGTGGHYEFVAIVPGEHENEIEHGDFFVRGAFKVVQEVVSSARASREWSAFKAEK